MKLLPLESLVKTSSVDHADWNYRPVLGAIMRLRYRLVAGLLPGRRVHRLLEIGYGSGVFLPELAQNCYELYGLDVHSGNRSVAEALARFGCFPSLFTGTAAAMPFQDSFFDCIVAVSTLEFVEDLKAVCNEVNRILRPDGSFIVVTPGHSPVVDLGLKLLTGASARRDFENRRTALIPTLRERFLVQQERTVPRFGGNLLRLYTGLRLAPQPAAAPSTINPLHPKMDCEPSVSR